MANPEKKSIYLETSIVSYLAARRSRNLVAAAWQEVSWRFWESHRKQYDLYTSEIVVEEATAGESEAVERRLAFLRGIPELPVDEEARSLAAAIIAEGVLPKKAEIDALHIAVATVNAMDYLLTWNCRHIENPATKPKVRDICLRLGYSYVEVCTPFSLVEE